jgi:DNA-binding SARP family transcriptional activator
MAEDVLAAARDGAAAMSPAGVRAGAGSTYLALLDSFRLKRDGVEVRLPVGGQRLLAILGLRGGMSRAAVAGVLWPNASEDRARGSLRTTLWRLGGAVPLVEVRPETLTLAPCVEVDLRSFCARAMRLSTRPVSGGPDLEAFLAMSGELLPGWYEDWVLFERERMRQIRLHALEAIAGGLAEAGQYGRAVEVALEAIRLEPLRESAHRVLVGVHLREDNLIEALRHYRSFRALLRQELGVGPSARLTAMITERMPAAAR